MEAEYVHYYRRQDRQRERHRYPQQQQRSAKNLGAEDQEEHVVGIDQRTKECAGGGSRRRIGHEMKKSVQAENEEDEAKENAGDDDCDFHASFSSRVIHSNRGRWRLSKI